MKKYVDGNMVEMTLEEIEELKKLEESLPAPEPTTEERLADLEQALALLLSGSTEVGA